MGGGGGRPKVRGRRGIPVDAGMDVSRGGMNAFPDVPEVVEDGRTLAANALKKARETTAATGLACVAELGSDPSRFDFQVRAGRAGPINGLLVVVGYRVREYSPVG